MFRPSRNLDPVHFSSSDSFEDPTASPKKRSSKKSRKSHPHRFTNLRRLSSLTHPTRRRRDSTYPSSSENFLGSSGSHADVLGPRTPDAASHVSPTSHFAGVDERHHGESTTSSLHSRNQDMSSSTDGKSGLSRYRPRIRGKPNLKSKRNSEWNPDASGSGNFTLLSKPHPRLVLDALSGLSSHVVKRLDLYELVKMHELDERNMELWRRVHSKRTSKTMSRYLDLGAESTGVFGFPLNQSSVYGWSSVVLGGHQFFLPIVVVACVEELYRNGLSERNLFKTLPDPIRLRQLIDLFSTGNLSSSDPRSGLRNSFGANTSLESESRSDICALLSTWMMALPEPIVPLSLYEVLWNSCVSHYHRSDVNREPDDRERERDRNNRIRISQLILHLLPSPNFSVFVYLLAFLSQVAVAQKATWKAAERSARGHGTESTSISSSGSLSSTSSSPARTGSSSKAGNQQENGSARMKTVGLLPVDAIADMFGEWVFGGDEQIGRGGTHPVPDTGRGGGASKSKQMLLWFLTRWNRISEGLLEVGSTLTLPVPSTKMQWIRDGSNPNGNGRYSDKDDGPDYGSAGGRDVSVGDGYGRLGEPQVGALGGDGGSDAGYSHDRECVISSSDVWSVESAARTDEEPEEEKSPHTGSSRARRDGISVARRDRPFEHLQRHLRDGEKSFLLPDSLLSSTRLPPTPSTPRQLPPLTPPTPRPLPVPSPSKDSGVSEHADAVVSIMRHLVDGVKDLQVEIAKAEENSGGKLGSDGVSQGIDTTKEKGPRNSEREAMKSDTLKLGLSQLARSLQRLGPDARSGVDGPSFPVHESGVRDEGGPPPSAKSFMSMSTLVQSSTGPPSLSVSHSSARRHSRPLPAPPVSERSIASASSASSAIDLNERLMGLSNSSSSFDTGVRIDNPLEALSMQEKGVVMNVDESFVQPTGARTQVSQRQRQFDPNHPATLTAITRDDNVSELCNKLYADMRLDYGTPSHSTSSSDSYSQPAMPSVSLSPMPNPPLGTASDVSETNVQTTPPAVNITPLVPKSIPVARPINVAPAPRNRSMTRHLSTLGIVQEEDCEERDDEEDGGTKAKHAAPPLNSFVHELQALKAQNMQAFGALEEANRKIAQLESKLNHGSNT